MLLLASFAIAGALSKHFIARWLAQAFLSKFGKRPRTVLIANMGVATFASMWISNVAAPVLCFSLLQPILRNLSAKDKFAKALVLGEFVYPVLLKGKFVCLVLLNGCGLGRKPCACLSMNRSFLGEGPQGGEDHHARSLDYSWFRHFHV